MPKSIISQNEAIFRVIEVLNEYTRLPDSVENPVNVRPVRYIYESTNSDFITMFKTNVKSLDGCIGYHLSLEGKKLIITCLVIDKQDQIKGNLTKERGGKMPENIIPRMPNYIFCWVEELNKYSHPPNEAENTVKVLPDPHTYDDLTDPLQVGLHAKGNSIVGYHLSLAGNQLTITYLVIANKQMLQPLKRLKKPPR